MSRFVFIILPCFNEEKNLSLLLNNIAYNLKDMPYQIMAVDDGSTDTSINLLYKLKENYPLHILKHNNNGGLSRALETGISYTLSLANNNDIIVIMDADNTHDPKYILPMIKRIDKGAEIVIASRNVKGSLQIGVPAYRIILSKILNIFISILSGLKVKDATSGYRCYKAKILKRSLNKFEDKLIESQGFEVQLELLMKLTPFSKRIEEIPIVLEYNRKIGKSKMRLFNTAKNYMPLLHKIATWNYHERTRKMLEINKTDSRKTRVVVVGLGKIGLSVATYLKYFADLEVYGYDVSLEAIKTAKRNCIKVESVWENIPSSDVYLICVSTGFNGEQADFSSIYEVGDNIGAYFSNDFKPLVSVESTVIPGTCRKLFKVLRENAYLIHVPHRYWPVDVINYGVKQKRVLGAINEESEKIGTKFYNEIEIPISIVSNIETAEMTKLAENSYRFLEIAYAEELSMICRKLGIDFGELRNSCNTLKRKSIKENWKVQILEARNGIRGTCLPKDVRYLLSISNGSELLKGAIAIDDLYKNLMQLPKILEYLIKI